MGCIIFETCGTDGDVLPFIRIGRKLLNYGHRVAIVTHSYYESIAKESKLDFISVDTPAEYAQFINDNASTSQNPQGHIFFLKRHVLSRVLRTYDKIKNYYVPGQTVIFSKSPGFISTIVSEKLDIPRVMCFFAPSFIMSKEFVITFYNLLKDDIISIRKELGLHSEYSWEKWWKSAERNIGLWPDWFEAEKSDSINSDSIYIERVGFVVDSSEFCDIPDDVKSLINDKEKPILINSSSSSLFINSDFFESSIKACEVLGQKAIIVGRHKEFMPANLPKGIYYFSHLPFGYLMTEAKAIIHHGGIGTSAQALASGLPQLVLAGGVDRPDNAMCLKRLGVGEYLLPPQWNYKCVMESLQRIITSKTVKEACLSVAEKMKKDNPIASICNIIDSILNSKERKMNKDKLYYEGNEFATLKKCDYDENNFHEKNDNENDIDKLIKNYSKEKLELALLLLTKSSPTTLGKESLIVKQPRKEGINIFPLTYYQERFWFLNKIEPNSLALNTFSAYMIYGNLNVEALEKTFNEIINRHENLRTTFGEIDGKPVQFVLPTIEFRLPVIDIQGDDRNNQNLEVERILSTKSYEPFDLSKGPLIRVLLIKLSEDEHIIWWGMHHIINDGWGSTVLIREIKELYSWFAYNKKHNLSELNVQCPDFAVWQRTYSNKGEKKDRMIKYWKKQLEGCNFKLSLPSDYTRPLVRTYNGSEELFYLPKSIRTKLKTLSNEVGVSLFMTLLSAFKLLVYINTNEHDIVIGSPVSGRNSEVLENLICDLTNMLVLRTVIDENDRIYDVMHKVKETALGAFQNQELPFQEIYSVLHYEIEPGYSPLFQMMFVFHEIFPQEKEQFLEGLNTRYLNIKKKVSQFDISLNMFDDNEEGLYGKFEYNTDLFSRETILKFVNQFKELLEVLIENPDLKISELCVKINDNYHQKLIKGEKEENILDIEKDIVDADSDNGAGYQIYKIL
ncbi:condensation domain-containing protein [Acetivibrio clariflavus]|uniref:condensation domain-containing protein n=1 Tax=Acetivibrio clariflavus TaxID=288965 RepID=UPI0031F570B3